MNESIISVCLTGIFTKDQMDYRLFGNLPISILGLISNAINVFVFMDGKMRSSLVNHFLFAITVSDLLLLLFNFFFLIFPVISILSDSFYLHYLYPIILRYNYPLARIAHTCGVYLTYIDFLQSPVHCAIMGSIIFSILINATTWLELTIVPCYSIQFKRISRHIQLTELQMDHTYGIIMKVITYTLVMFIIPFFILIIVNSRIVIALRRSTNLRRSHLASTTSSNDALNSGYQ
ncbi:unnamed protein product [Dracunculus medinensis]|uniref:G_PROTEIN_RECEP_F1_2 domain-containing protein n=1 Tax=Dracunculus medinensis TaxID=318479 RepID=A0A0N4UNG6_DRAME|nr:unnamed protein product [Dracunculus medinensis]